MCSKVFDRCIAWAGACLFLILPLAAQAQQHDGWTVENRRGLCFASIIYNKPGIPILAIGMRKPDAVALSVASMDWSAQSGITYQAEIEIDGEAYGPVSFEGFSREEYSGFKFAAPANQLLPIVMAGREIRLRSGSTTTDNLSLKGSAWAINQLRKCVADQNGKAPK